MASKDGVANLLAMPYGSGHARSRPAIAATKPIENVAVSMSVDRATDAKRDDYAGRMRLRGIFQPAGSRASDLVRQAGGGRWVSLVYEQPDEAHDRHRLAWRSTARSATAGRWPTWIRFGAGPAKRSNFYRALSGRRGDLAWRYMLLEPVDFEQSLVVKPNTGDKLGDRLALFYLKN